ncbi:MAG: putative DNA-binding protein (MmcQ/YjbR family) [Halieaceae bacterium]|jgi:predicted DNA-binding protein (MmcQ/YjbR family)
MDYSATRAYLLTRPEAVEEFPFGPGVAVFKIVGKMFATLGESKGIASTNLKCDPQEAQMLRDIFESVVPGYHMNKQHWNTVILDGTVPEFEINRMIDRSYGLVVKKLKKAERTALEIRCGSEALYR